MKYKLLPCLALVFIFASCSSTYKATQTPDDVYYSPAPPAVAENENKKNDKYEEYVSSQDDQYIRMKVRNRNRWQWIDDYDYWNDTRYNPYNSYSYYQNNWNSWYTWNSWNNPFYTVGYNNHCCCYSPYNNISYGYYYPVKVPGTTRSNVGSYYNNNYNNNNQNNNIKVFSSSSSVIRGYNNKNSNSNSGSSSSTNRSYTPSSSSSSSSSSSGTISRPKRN